MTEKTNGAKLNPARDRNQPPVPCLFLSQREKEKKLLFFERAIEKNDIEKMRRILKTKGGIEKVKKKARRKIEIMKLQMEIEQEMTEGEIRNRRRIAENAKMFKFGCKFERKKE